VKPVKPECRRAGIPMKPRAPTEYASQYGTEHTDMMLDILQAALQLTRLRWEMRARDWGTRALDDRLRRDIGLPPRQEAGRPSSRHDWY
jgi:hypothetical protein